jgi:Putative transposase
VTGRPGGGSAASPSAASVPIRQWVSTVPVRYQLAFAAGLTRAVLRVFLRTIFGWQRRRATRRGVVGARSGSVTAMQRFGGALNANVHFHALVFDGVYTRATPTARPVFHRLPPPTDTEIALLLKRLHRRVRRGCLAEDNAGGAVAGTGDVVLAVFEGRPAQVAHSLAGQPIAGLSRRARVPRRGPERPVGPGATSRPAAGGLGLGRRSPSRRSRDSLTRRANCMIVRVGSYPYAPVSG